MERAYKVQLFTRVHSHEINKFTSVVRSLSPQTLGLLRIHGNYVSWSSHKLLIAHVQWNFIPISLDQLKYLTLNSRIKSILRIKVPFHTRFPIWLPLVYMVVTNIWFNRVESCDLVHSKLHNIIDVHVVLWCYVVLTWMHDNKKSI